MAEVIFYEKPGCINNTRQKRMLAFAGHLVVARNLLTETWSCERLQQFFALLPVADWFNHTAPLVRDGVINPDRIEPQIALAEMMAEPLLIRRPLMIIDGVPVAGFDVPQLNAQFALGLETGEGDVEGCPRKPEHDQGCEVKA